MEKNIKIKIILLILVIITSIFSGCVDKNKEISSIKNYEKDPFVNIIAPSRAYFNESITFDVEKINNENKIRSYTWDFQDGGRLNGEKVSYEYDFSSEMGIEYPLVYTVTLMTEYKDNSIRASKHRIKLFPKEFVLYLDKNSIQKDKPEYSYEKISENLLSLDNKKEISFYINDEVYLEKCSWEARLSIEKPYLSSIKSVKIILFDDENNKFSEGIIENKITGMRRDIWLKINGEISEEHRLMKIKIVFETSSFLTNTKLKFGGNNPSRILFDFVE